MEPSWLALEKVLHLEEDRRQERLKLPWKNVFLAWIDFFTQYSRIQASADSKLDIRGGARLV